MLILGKLNHRIDKTTVLEDKACYFYFIGIPLVKIFLLGTYLFVVKVSAESYTFSEVINFITSEITNKNSSINCYLFKPIVLNSLM